MKTSKNLTQEELCGLYETMLLIQQFELTTVKAYQDNLIQGAVHVYLGQESVAVGCCAHLNDGDFIASTHRGHGHCIAKGGDPALMMAEILGKATGYCGGKGGSMHIADLDLGILGANGIVGGGIGMATGAAFSAKYRQTDNVAVVFFGDGALHQGIFHECANMAGLWDLPIIFVCEYNQFAEFTRSEATFAKLDLAERSKPYGFPGVEVDGSDVLAVFDATGEAVDRARSGNGPSLIVADCYRLGGHYVGDPLTYRTTEEVIEAEKTEPIATFRRKLLEHGLDVADLQAIEEAVAQRIDAALEFAVESPAPAADHLTTNVYGFEDAESTHKVGVSN